MITYEDNLSLLFTIKGSVLPRSALYALPGVICVVMLGILKNYMPNAKEALGLGTGFINSSSMWNAMTSVMGILVAFRIKQALGRFWEGSSLLHQMRGEWFDAASCLITFSRGAKIHHGMQEEVDDFRNTLVRLMSLMHGVALDEISGSASTAFNVIDIHGIDTKTLVFLRACENRNRFSKVEALQHLIQVLVVANHELGVLTIPAPILTRVFQSLSRGFVNLLNARKITDTYFPLPFVQTIKVLLVVHTLFTPLLMSEITGDAKVWGVFFTFIPLFGLHALNLTAWQLEMPFGSDSNDLPLFEFQEEMNDTLLMLVDEGTDHLPCASSQAEKSLSQYSPLREQNRLTLASRSLSNSRTLERDSFFRGRKSLGLASYQITSPPIRPSSSAGSVSHTKLLTDPAFLNSRSPSPSCSEQASQMYSIGEKAEAIIESTGVGSFQSGLDTCFVPVAEEKKRTPPRESTQTGTRKDGRLEYQLQQMIGDLEPVGATTPRTYVRTPRSSPRLHGNPNLMQSATSLQQSTTSKDKAIYDGSCLGRSIGMDSPAASDRSRE